MEKLQPKLRFPEFDGDWEDTSLEVIGEYIGGGTPKTSIQEYWQGEIPWISSSDIFENDIHNINVQKYITEDAVINSATKKIPAGSLIIVSRVGVGKFAINSTEVCTSQDFTNIVIDKESYDPNFAAFNLYKNIEILFNISQGTSIKGFTITELKKTNLSFPSISEQTKIANFLSSVDEKLNLLKEKKALLQEYKKGMMQQIFSQQLRFKDEDGKDFADWEEKTISEVLSIGSGRDYKHLDTGKIPVFGTGGLMTYVDSFLHDGATVCIGRKGTIDKPMYFEGKLWTVDTLFYTFNFINSVPKFIYYVFQSINWKSHNEASGVPSLSKSTIEKIEIKVPSKEEQTKIANFLSAIDEKIELVAQQIEATQEYKRGLLQGMFC